MQIKAIKTTLDWPVKENEKETYIFQENLKLITFPIRLSIIKCHILTANIVTHCIVLNN